MTLSCYHAVLYLFWVILCRSVLTGSIALRLDSFWVYRYPGGWGFVRTLVRISATGKKITKFSQTIWSKALIWVLGHEVHNLFGIRKVVIGSVTYYNLPYFGSSAVWLLCDEFSKSSVFKLHNETQKNYQIISTIEHTD